MRNSKGRNWQHRGGSPAIQADEPESEDWGVRWIQSCKRIRDGESRADTERRASEQKPLSESQPAETTPDEQIIRSTTAG